MRHRLATAILLLYPRRVRRVHGFEIVALIDDLIVHEGRSRTRLLLRLAADGLIQRASSTATVWTVAAALAATSFGGLAFSGFAAASAHQRTPRRLHTVADGPRRDPPHLPVEDPATRRGRETGVLVSGDGSRRQYRDWLSHG